MLNKAILVGRLVDDPELKQTASGISVLSFTLACQRRYQNQSNGQRSADFIDLVAWRSTAEFIAKYFTKGKLIGIDGSIQTRIYQDKNGNNRKAVEVLVDNAYFIESKGSSSTFEPAQPAAVSSQQNMNYSNGDTDDFEEFFPEDDLPF